MRLVSIAQCAPGQRLGRPIYNEDGRVLLAAGMELTSTMIRRLIDYGILHAYISDPRTDDIVIPDLISGETRARAVSQIRSTFRALMDDTRRKNVAGSLAKDFKDVLEMIVDDLSGHKSAMVMLMDMQVSDHYLYSHSLNVGIMSCLIGMHIGYERNDLLAFGLGALLHDIGKTKVPLELLSKNGKLTSEQFEVVKLHCEQGYVMLKDEPNIPLLSAHCALQHHERIDGSGYPRGLKGDEIHDYAQWLGIIDSYDAMISRRVYREAILPHEAMEALYAKAGTLYPLEKVVIFRNKIASYPLGTTVTLQTGEVGVVVDINAASPHRPVIRILEDKRGTIALEPYEIDLSKHLSIMIVGFNEHLKIPIQGTRC